MCKNFIIADQWSIFQTDRQTNWVDSKWKEQTFEGSDSNFGPKVVSWTEWKALVPILALLRPFRGVFGSWVDFGALWGSNFWNNQMDPLFLILLLILHLNSWKRYTFDISGPKWAQNSQNRLKMAKIRYSHMAIFWKNITSDLSQNGPKYKSRTILHFDIGLG